MSDNEKKEYEKAAEQYYKEKVKKLSECCKKFEDYLKKTADEPIDWYLKFGEVFKDYLKSKKVFSRTNSILKNIQKQLSRPKPNWAYELYYKNIFKFSHAYHLLSSVMMPI